MTYTFHIVGRKMTITHLDMYQLTGLNMSGCVIHLLELADNVHLDQIYQGFSTGSTSMSERLSWRASRHARGSTSNGPGFLM